MKIKDLEKFVVYLWQDIELGTWTESIDPFDYLIGARSLVASTVGAPSEQWDFLTLAIEQLHARVFYGSRDNFRAFIWR